MAALLKMMMAGGAPAASVAEMGRALAAAKEEKKLPIITVSKMVQIVISISNRLGLCDPVPWNKVRIFINLQDTVIINIDLLESIAAEIKPRARGEIKEFPDPTPADPDGKLRYATCEPRMVDTLLQLKKMGIHFTFVVGRPESQKEHILGQLAAFNLEGFADVICTGGINKGPFVKKLIPDDDKTILFVAIDSTMGSLETYVAPTAFPPEKIMLVLYKAFETIDPEQGKL
ncbi:MAG: hypothetical protein Hyperionvirus1_187 [Hyperionvirus sp.]|uniref:Uncharacterized protein n=1 Tax=Hyperionvirus sp. TaxID=2487770 RepID=A0A3G5A605_9VIRU|nr:MAG: hypothetical protein Hyperionvirus1_187 [Hyperionvirus sp.]